MKSDSDVVRALLEASTALDDWLNTFATEFCDQKRAAEAFARIAANGGTVGYIAALQQRIRAALEARQSADHSLVKEVAKSFRTDKRAMETFRWLWNNADTEFVQVSAFERVVEIVLSLAASRGAPEKG